MKTLKHICMANLGQILRKTHPDTESEAEMLTSYLESIPVTLLADLEDIIFTTVTPFTQNDFQSFAIFKTFLRRVKLILLTFAPPLTFAPLDLKFGLDPKSF